MEGYSKLGNLLASYPELAGFRKYGRLNYELLCYKAAELNKLENEIDGLRLRETAETKTSWEALVNSKEHYSARKFQKLARLDRKMRTYRQDLLEMVQFEAMHSPPKLGIQSIRCWLAHDSGGRRFFKRNEGCQWWPDNEKDLVAVSSQYDRLDQACMNSLSSFFHAVAKRWKDPAGDEEAGLHETWRYSPKHFKRVADVLCVLTSALIPCASVVGLFYARSMEEKLAMISVFILVFSGVVLLGFRCRRSETLAATVAFAAVQVVFVESVNNYSSK